MRATTHPHALGADITAVIFGLDGVIVDSAGAAALAWKAALDPFLHSHAATCEVRCRPFDEAADYPRYMHGRTRLDGVRGFLRSHEIDLTYDDLRGLAGHQEELFLTEIRRGGVRPFASAVTLIEAVRRQGIRTAAVSTHRYTAELLTRAGVTGLFDVQLDGLDAPGTRLPAPSDPCLYREAALRLDLPPAHVAVVEESLDALTAGHRGGFGLVIGVDRIGRAATLREHGADLIIADLAELRLSEPVA